jgi:hypothetical protein
VGSCGHSLQCQTVNLTASLGLGAGRAYPVPKTPGRRDWTPKPISGRGGRQNRETGGEILPAHDYCEQVKVKVWITPGFSFFRLVAPPLQPGVAGPYLAQAIWFPSYLLLEGTGHF